MPAALGRMCVGHTLTAHTSRMERKQKEGEQTCESRVHRFNKGSKSCAHKQNERTNSFAAVYQQADVQPLPGKLGLSLPSGCWRAKDKHRDHKRLLSSSSSPPFFSEHNVNSTKNPHSQLSHHALSQLSLTQRWLAIRGSMGNWDSPDIVPAGLSTCPKPTGTIASMSASGTATVQLHR